ncbi:hypothetical protein BX600DRAFT_458547, partial [Xylariales sp. PMI_506]
MLVVFLFILESLPTNIRGAAKRKGGSVLFILYAPIESASANRSDSCPGGTAMLARRSVECLSRLSSDILDALFEAILHFCSAV